MACSTRSPRFAPPSPAGAARWPEDDPVPRFWRWFWVVVLGVPVAAFTVWGLVDNAKLFCTTALNGLTLAALYFLVASGFTLVFGLMRNVNLAHGSLYLLGAYVGYVVGEWTGSWLLAVAAGFASAALFGLVLQVAVFRFMHGEDLRQTLVTIGLSIMMADILLWIFGGEIYQFDPPRAIFGRTALPIVEVYPTYRLVLLAMSAAIGGLLWWFLNRTRVGMMIRAGVDDRGMLVGAAIGAILIVVAEQFGLAYAPTYSVVFTFVIMALVLAFRPQGILGRRA